MYYINTAKVARGEHVSTERLNYNNALRNSDIKFETSQATSTKSLQASLHSPALDISTMPPALVETILLPYVYA